jgi:thiamine biosynthesis protein ThiF, family 2
MYENSLDVGLTRYLSNESLEKIRKTTVGIAGAGGLGSNVAQMLVRCGFCKFVLVDFDIIEPSNLNRQFFFFDQIGKSKVLALTENLKKINPTIDVQAHVIRITRDNTAEIFGDCDILVEAMDKPDSKATFVSAALPLNKPVICVSGIAGFGHSDDIKITKKSANWYMVGDGESGIGEGVPPLAPRVMVAAAKQADIVLSLALENR